MRVGIIAPPWIPIPPSAYGGIESFIDTLAVALDEMGVEVVLAASGDSTCPVTRLPGFAPSDETTMGNTAVELRHLIHAFEGLADADVDVVLDNTLAGPLTSGVLWDRPIATVAHGPMIEMVRELYSVAPHVAYVAISRHQASLAGSVRIERVIHHGMRVEDVPVGPGGDDLCFVGRMHPVKGLVEAIRTAEAAGMHLRIAAKMNEPAEEEYFAEVVKPMLGRHAEYVGELSADEKYRLMGESKVLLNPIQWDEPFGLVMIESLATGTPVLATPRGSVPEIIEEGVTGFIRWRSDDLVHALERVGELDRATCRAQATERFSAERMAADYITLFEDLLERARPSRRVGLVRRQEDAWRAARPA